MKTYKIIVTITFLFTFCTALIIILPSGLESNSNLQNEADSLKVEIKILKELLAEKLVSACDTMTPEEKIKQVKLDEYSVEIYKLRDAEEQKIYKQRDAAESAAYKEQEDLSMESFLVYREAESGAVKDFQKNDPVEFSEYAVLCFLDDHFGSDDYSYHEELVRKEQSVPSMKKFSDFQRAAYKKHRDNEEKLSDSLQKTLGRLRANCQASLKEVNDRAQEAIDKKKAELGL